MSSEETLIEIRKSKHQELNNGTYPLPKEPTSMGGLYNVSYYIYALGEKVKTSIIPEELSSFVTIVVHGRITAIRKSGSIRFIKVTDSTGSIQLIVSKAALSSYNDMSLLDLGDIIEAYGKPCL